MYYKDSHCFDVFCIVTTADR